MLCAQYFVRNAYGAVALSPYFAAVILC